MMLDSKQIKTDFCQLIGMALQSKMSWKVLANILEGIIPSFEESKEVINILLIELEKLQLILMEKEKVDNKSNAQDEIPEDIESIADEKFTEEIVENDVHVQYNITTETEHFSNKAKKLEDTLPESISMEDNDIEILEVVKESMGEEISTELNGGTFFSGVNDNEKHMDENDSGNNGISDMSLSSVRPISQNRGSAEPNCSAIFTERSAEQFGRTSTIKVSNLGTF